MDSELSILSVVLMVLVAHILYVRRWGTVTAPETWTVAEQPWMRLAALVFGAGAIASGLVATYVATRIPWVDNLPAVLGNAAPNARMQSTANYLFVIPLVCAVAGAWIIDPLTARWIRFRGPRELLVRLTPVAATGVSAYAIWKALDALRAATH